MMFKNSESLNKMIIILSNQFIRVYGWILSIQTVTVNREIQCNYITVMKIRKNTGCLKMLGMEMFILSLCMAFTWIPEEQQITTQIL